MNVKHCKSLNNSRFLFYYKISFTKPNTADWQHEQENENPNPLKSVKKEK